MRWKKLGIVYCPDGSVAWAKSHAMIPTPFLLNPETIRVYLTFCDEAGIGRPGWVDLASADPTQVLRVCEKPLFDVGVNGSFDENGVLTCSVIRMPDGCLHLYYAGFELGTKIRYRLLTGLAISHDNGDSFVRYSKVPVLERSDQELHIRGGPWATLEDHQLKLWYVGGSEWIELAGKRMPVYDLRFVSSSDGKTFPAQGELQMAITGDDEHGFGRPCVLREANGLYRMFYSVRRKSFAAYRLGYAESLDGRHWQRKDDVLNLDVEPGSFDSDAIMYAAPLRIGDKLYLFYNGNDFGKAGFACAVLEQE